MCIRDRDKAEETHIARYNGLPAIWVVTALKDRNNIVQNRVAIQKSLDEFQTTLPDHIKMETSFDQEKNVRRRLYGLGIDFAIAVSLVLLTLLPLGSVSYTHLLIPSFRQNFDIHFRY